MAASSAPPIGLPTTEIHARFDPETGLLFIDEQYARGWFRKNGAGYEEVLRFLPHKIEWVNLTQGYSTAPIRLPCIVVQQGELKENPKVVPLRRAK